MFHIKKEPACKVPTWKQPDPQRSQKIEFRNIEWRIMEEQQVVDVAHLAALVKEHGGLLLSGPAGVGKSTKLSELMPLLSELMPGKAAGDGPAPLHVDADLRQDDCSLPPQVPPEGRSTRSWHDRGHR